MLPPLQSFPPIRRAHARSRAAAETAARIVTAAVARLPSTFHCMTLLDSHAQQLTRHFLIVFVNLER